MTRVSVDEYRLLAPVTEPEFQAQVCQFATLCGWRYYHTLDSRKSVAGFPDLVLVRPPRLVFAELKTERGHVAAEQELWLDALKLVPGVEARLWRPSDWPTIQSVLR